MSELARVVPPGGSPPGIAEVRTHATAEPTDAARAARMFCDALARHSEPPPAPVTDCPCRLHFIVPVWGETYVKRFLSWGLPSHLAPGNLPAVAGVTRRYDIVTDEAGAELVRQAPGYEKLRALCEVRVVVPGAHDHRHGLADDELGYLQMTRFYNAAIADTAAPDVAHVFLTAEGIFSDGTFAAIARRFAHNYRAVVLPGLRVCEEDAMDDLLAHHRDEAQGTLRAAPRALVGWAMRHPHPITRAHTWGADGARLHPHYYFRVGDEGLVAHCFHMHPLAVWPEGGEPEDALVPPRQTLDHEYLQETVNFPAVHLVQDSDEMVVVDIAARAHLADTIHHRPYTLAEIAEFAETWTNAYHRRWFERPVRFLAADVGPQWQDVEAQARAHVEHVNAHLLRGTPMRVYAAARAPSADPRDPYHPWWLRTARHVAWRLERLAARVQQVGWLRVFAIRSRCRALIARLRRH